MTDVLAEFEALLRDMSPQDKAQLDKVLEAELKAAWLPNPGPQTEAYYSQADELLYGGAAGGGKTDLIVGLALGEHKRTVIFRRAYGELSDVAERFLDVLGSRDGFNGQDMRYRKGETLVEFGALEKPGSEKAWRGRAHDLICFDEGAELSRQKVAFVMGWLRSTDPNQRCRVVIASNPPTGGEGEWLIEWFAPWLDPLHPNPAAPGELRWCITVGDDTVWKDGPGKTVIDGEEYTHVSRTFVPARLDDNPYLKDTNYRAKLQSMPEPLRSQLLKGDFLAGREDHEWQVIPTAWVDAANERWERTDPKKRRQMLALAMDVAMGGQDSSVIAKLHSECWFAPLLRRRDLTDPAEHAAVILQERKDEADVAVDCTGGWGSGVRSNLINHNGVDCASIVFSSGSDKRTRDGTRGFRNLRAEMWWGFREALDPDGGDDVMLPPDARLKAELTTSRWKPEGDFIKVELKEDVKKRVGGSPDSADAVIMAWHRRAAAAKREAKVQRMAKLNSRAREVVPKSIGWMGR